MTDSTPELIERLCENCTCWVSPTLSEGSFDECDNCKAASALKEARIEIGRLRGLIAARDSALRIYSDQLEQNVLTTHERELIRSAVKEICGPRNEVKPGESET
jgi:hypothetical protein